MNHIDLPSIAQLSVGFDRMFNELNRIASSNTNYPPYNLVQFSDTDYAVEVAVAGFTEEELDVELREGKLYISGKKVHSEKDAEKYLYRGISSRNFTRVIPLAENIEVKNATIKNGLLSVFLKQVIPEELKPKKIPIRIAS